MSDSKSRKKPFLLVAWLSFWHAVTWLRTAVFNLLFLFILLIVLAVTFAPRDLPIPTDAPLLVAPAGILVDQIEYTPPIAQFFDPNAAKYMETRVRDLVKVIEAAGEDDRIPALLLQLDYLEGGGISKLQEVGAAIERFKTSGKPVVAFGDSLSQQQYFLATFADEIYLHDMGSVLLTGYGIYRSYFKDALDKLEVGFEIFKVGEYKDAIEPFTRNDMSSESREHNALWLEQLWSNYTEHTEAKRGLEAGSLQHMIDHIDGYLAEVDGDPAQLALQMNLVDYVSTKVARTQALIDQFGPAADDELNFHHVSYDHYRRDLMANTDLSGNVGLIVASGTILEGEQPEGTIGSDTLSQLIRRARLDPGIRALVLRVDSGGGSAFASEVIRHELQAVRDAGKPVVVSMGSVAASGGYWIALAADEIWATPTTITGSIGVFGLFPALHQGLPKLGIHSDGVGTTKLSEAGRLDRPLPTIAANALQQSVESIYNRFITLVADARGLTPAEVYPIAEGRVWSGTSAHELGLVDQLGDLEDALTSAAQLAELPVFQVKEIERVPTPYEMLLREMLDQTRSIGLDQQALLSSQVPTPVLAGIKKLVSENAPVFNGRPARSTYALCLACTPP